MRAQVGRRALVGIALAFLASMVACSPYATEDRQRLENLQDDPVASHAPPTGKSLSGYESIGRSSWDLWEGSQESESVVVRRWEVTASPSEVADDLASALETNGWIIESENRSEDAIGFEAGKDFTGYCAKALVSAQDFAVGGRATIWVRLSAPYSGSADDGCSDE